MDVAEGEDGEEAPGPVQGEPEGDGESCFGEGTHSPPISLKPGYFLASRLNR